MSSVTERLSTLLANEGFSFQEAQSPSDGPPPYLGPRYQRNTPQLYTWRCADAFARKDLRRFLATPFYIVNGSIHQPSVRAPWRPHQEAPMSSVTERLSDEEGDKLCSLQPGFVAALYDLPDAALLEVIKQVHASAYTARSEGLRVGRREGRRAIVDVVHELLGIGAITEGLTEISVRISEGQPR